MTIYLGGLTFQLTWERTPKSYGHSRGDLTLYIPQRRVMFMGDLLNTEVHPGRGAVSQIQGWPEVLDMIIQRQLPVETFVPGHGPVHIGRGVADLEEQKRYFVVIQDEMTKMMQAGKSVEEIQKELEIPQEFAHYKGPDRLRFLLPFFYNQILDRGL